VVLLPCAFWNPCAKAEPSDKAASSAVDEKVEYKTVTGTASGVGSGFIAVEFQRDEKKGASLEMALPVDEQITFNYKALKLGDTVAVEYREATAKDDHGEYTRVKRAATRITLVKRAADAATTRTEGSRAE